MQIPLASPQRDAVQPPPAATGLEVGHIRSEAEVAHAADGDVGCFYGFIEEVLQRGRFVRAAAFLADGFVEHVGNQLRGRSEFVASIDARRARFPDAVWTIEILLEVNGIVICHASVTSINIPDPSWENMLVRFESGKMAECWRTCHASLAEPC